MTPEFGVRSSEKYKEEIKDIDCPLCGKCKVTVTFISGYMSWNVSRIAAGAKRTPYFHDPKIKVNMSCKGCKSSKAEIKEALEKGKKISHEERLKRIKEAGLPTQLDFEAL